MGTPWSCGSGRWPSALGETTVRMLGYNGSVPGPPSRSPRAASSLSRWPTRGPGHHRALARAAAGEPLRRRPPPDPGPHPGGGRFTYRIQVPDPGLYWDHPHIREDYTQELGLYGNLLVAPADPGYWPEVDRELVLTVDDLLIEDGQVAPFSRTETSHAAMGRFGNVFWWAGSPTRSWRPGWGRWCGCG
jgi:hypothetical protein